MDQKPPIEIPKPSALVVNDMVELIISAVISKANTKLVSKNTEPLQNNSPSCIKNDLILPVFEIPTDDTPKSRWNKLGTEIGYETPIPPQFDRRNILQTDNE